MLPPLQQASSLALLILLLGAGLARTLALLDIEQAWKESEAAFSMKSQGLLANYNPHSFSWKTCQLSLVEAEGQLLQNLPKAGMSVGGLLYQLKPLERTIKESVGGYWLSELITTPDASERGATKFYDPKAKSQSGRTPQTYAKAFPTPAARDWKDNASPSEYKRKTPPLSTHAGGQLNPTFVEWLMGYPIGWTELQPLETGRFREWLQQHGGC
jgi:hypothetical protein